MDPRTARRRTGVVIALVLALTSFAAWLGPARRPRMRRRGSRSTPSPARDSRRPVETWEATPVDFDGDGDQDVWIGYHDQGGKLWRNNGRASTAWRPCLAPGQPPRAMPDRHYCAWADVDRNGLLDTYCAAGRGGQNLVKTGQGQRVVAAASPGQFTDVGPHGESATCAGGVTTSPSSRERRRVARPVRRRRHPARRVSDPCDDPRTGCRTSYEAVPQPGRDRVCARRPAIGINGTAGLAVPRCLDLNRDGRRRPARLRQTDHHPLSQRREPGSATSRSANGLTTNHNDAEFGDLDRDGDADLVTALWGRVSTG